MPNILRRLVPVLLAALAVLPASAAITVSFRQPQNYIDVDRFDELDNVTYGLEQHLKALGERYLRPGQELKIEILDIDLAGERHLVRRPQRDIRVVRDLGIDSPSIDLHYSLEESGKVVASGQEHVADMRFMNRGNVYAPDDYLRYEKRMLDAWFKQRFVERRPPH